MAESEAAGALDGADHRRSAGGPLVRVRYYAAAAEASGTREETLVLERSAGEDDPGGSRARERSAAGDRVGPRHVGQRHAGESDPVKGAGRPTLADLRDQLIGRYGEPMRKIVGSGSFLIDGVARRDPAFEIPSDGSAAVDVLPPFAGG